jgi:hypothetical protein
MQERIPKDNREDLEVIEVVSLVNGSGSADGYHRVVVEEKAKCRPVCGLHERAFNWPPTMGSASPWEPFRNFPHLLQPPYPFSRISPRVAVKNFP